MEAKSLQQCLAYEKHIIQETIILASFITSYLYTLCVFIAEIVLLISIPNIWHMAGV